MPSGHCYRRHRNRAFYPGEILSGTWCLEVADVALTGLILNPPVNPGIASVVLTSDGLLAAVLP